MGKDNAWLDGFLSSLSMILVSEIGDKTFFIAALLAMRYNRLTVYAGALGALAVMTVLSAMMGLVLPSLLSVRVTNFFSAVLFFIFGVRILYEVFVKKRSDNDDDDDDEMEEAAAAVRQRESALRSGRRWTFCVTPLMIEAFVLTFLAEWGDRSQVSTIVLAAARNPYAVTAGGVLGHAICTGMAVIGGSMVAQKVSMRTVNIIGGVLFVIFGVLSLIHCVKQENSSLPVDVSSTVPTTIPQSS